MKKSVIKGIIVGTIIGFNCLLLEKLLSMADYWIWYYFTFMK